MACEDWPLVPLGELTENFDGRRVPVKEIDRKPGPYPYYGASGIVDRVDSYLFDGEFLLIGEDGENLRTRQTPIAFVATGKFWVNNHAHIVRGNHRADTRFLCYALSQTDISGYLTGSTMPKLTQGNLNRMPVIAPPLAEQKRIAEVLGALDDKIELNRRMNATLEATARALFQSWFIDFDPVRRNMDRNQPSTRPAGHPSPNGRRDGDEGAFGLDPATAALFPDSFEESELGQIPKGWTVGRVADVTDFSRTSINPGEFPDETFDHYSLPAFDEGRTPKAELGSAIMSNKLVVTRNSVLLSKLNPHIPRIWLPDLHATRRSACSTEFIVASTQSGYSSEFLFSLFTSASFASTYGTLVTGTTGSHQRIRPESVQEMKTVIPPHKLVEAFTSIAKPMFEQVNRNIDQSRTLATLRDTLLPKLLSGELSVQ
jgi:type I restriction enzyme S subunit